MAWIRVSVNDLRAALNAPEFSAYTSEALALDAAAILSAQVELARGYCPVKDAETDTIPPELKSDVLKLAVVELLRGVTGIAGLDEVLGRRYDEAMARLRDVAAGRLQISAPSSTGGAPPAPSPRFTENTRQFSRENQEGL